MEKANLIKFLHYHKILFFFTLLEVERLLAVALKYIW